MLQLAEHSNIAAKVQEHAESPIVSVETFLTIPSRLRVAPLRSVLRIEVEHKHIAIVQVSYHSRIRTCAPSLHHPDSLWIDCLHGSHYSLTSLTQVYPTGVATFMEGVHAIEVCLAVETLLLLIIYRGYFGKTL